MNGRNTPAVSISMLEYGFMRCNQPLTCVIIKYFVHIFELTEQSRVSWKTGFKRFKNITGHKQYTFSLVRPGVENNSCKK